MKIKKTDKIFVSGHTGLVGSAIIRELKKKGYKKIITATKPIMAARVPASTESAPKPGPTVRSSRIFKGAGSAPARSKIANHLPSRQ